MENEIEYKLIDVTENNINDWYLFCRKTKQKTEGYQNKLSWTIERFKEGLHHILLLVKETHNNKFAARGFIEYIPGKYNWRGISAENYMVIHCLWVVGKYKQKGFASKLIAKCIEDSKGMDGVAVVTAKKKGWCVGRNIFIKNQFEKCDEHPAGFELYIHQFSGSDSLPNFNSSIQPSESGEYNHITIHLSKQCPFLIDAAEIVTNVAKKYSIPTSINKINNCQEAQNGSHPYGTYYVMLNGNPLTYHYETEKKMDKIISKIAKKDKNK